MFGSVCFWIFNRFAIFNYFTAEPVRITVFLNEFLRAQLTVDLCYSLFSRFNRSINIRKIEDAENSKKLLEQNELSDKIKLKDFLGIQKFDTEKLREIIKVIHVHSQDEIEIEWNFDDIFSEQR